MCPLVSLLRNLLLQLKLLSAMMLGQKAHPLRRRPKATSARGPGWCLGFHPCRFLLPQIEKGAERKQFINFSVAAQISTRWCGASSRCVLDYAAACTLIPLLTACPQHQTQGKKVGWDLPSRDFGWLDLREGREAGH